MDIRRRYLAVGVVVLPAATPFLTAEVLVTPPGIGQVLAVTSSQTGILLADDAGIDAMVGGETSVKWRWRGANTFVINYQDADPDRAKAVTQRLTTLLRDKAAAVRVESAQATAKFAAQLRSVVFEAAMS